MSHDAKPDAKILFQVPDDDGSANVETLWAYDLGGDRYKLANCPFYAYGVSLEDVVYAPYDANEERATFKRVVSKSGNRTVRIKFDQPVEPGNRSDEVLQGLIRLGCDYEGATRKYISVNVPACVDLDAVRDYLVNCNATWEHADPTYAELHPDDE